LVEIGSVVSAYMDKNLVWNHLLNKN
jgi:hypothetical protein